MYEDGEESTNLPPVWDWIDPYKGLIREEEIDSGDAIELIDYQAPLSKTRAKNRFSLIYFGISVSQLKNIYDID